MRVVLDANVLVAGLSSKRRASHALFKHIAHGRLQPCTAAALWLEHESILKRPEILRRHGLAPDSLEHFINLAVAEKISALETADFFRQRAARGNPQALHAILDRVRDSL